MVSMDVSDPEFRISRSSRIVKGFDVFNSGSCVGLRPSSIKMFFVGWVSAASFDNVIDDVTEDVIVGDDVVCIELVVVAVVVVVEVVVVAVVGSVIVVVVVVVVVVV